MTATKRGPGGKFAGSYGTGRQQKSGKPRAAVLLGTAFVLSILWQNPGVLQGVAVGVLVVGGAVAVSYGCYRAHRWYNQPRRKRARAQRAKVRAKQAVAHRKAAQPRKATTNG